MAQPGGVGVDVEAENDVSARTLAEAVNLGAADFAAMFGDDARPVIRVHARRRRRGGVVGFNGLAIDWVRC